MKQWIFMTLCVLVLCGIPFLLYPEAKTESAAPIKKTPTVKRQATTVMATAPEAENATQQTELSPFDSAVTLRVLTGDGVKQMSLEEYLIGALTAEMPASFPDEALKAQAIASRTFALRQAEAGKHDGADICTDSGCCQGWSCDASEENQSRLCDAVRATDGLVVTYEDELIDATFFSCSGGRTESAVAVWGGEIPYLKSVDSPGEEEAPRYSETQTLEPSYFADTLRAAYPQINLSGKPNSWFGPVVYTEGGGVATAFIGGTAIEGTTLRRLFSLRSTDIRFQVTEAGIEVTTHGFGHRVGFSQYGAKAMAEEGKDFEEILLHYYAGTEIKRLLRQSA